MKAVAALFKILLIGFLIVLGGVGLFFYLIISLAPQQQPDSSKPLNGLRPTEASVLGTESSKEVVTKPSKKVSAVEQDYEEEMCEIVREENGCDEAGN